MTCVMLGITYIGSGKELERYIESKTERAIKTEYDTEMV